MLSRAEGLIKQGGNLVWNTILSLVQWKLLSATLEDTDGNVSYPFGKDPIGCLTYTTDGYMHWAVMQANRIPLASGDIRDATDAEKVAAAESYIAYCGRYTLEAGKVIHHIEISSIPNQVGGAHERFSR